MYVHVYFLVDYYIFQYIRYNIKSHVKVIATNSSECTRYTPTNTAESYGNNSADLRPLFRAQGLSKLLREFLITSMLVYITTYTYILLYMSNALCSVRLSRVHT